MKFFTADPHFGHQSIIDTFSKRPFASLEEMHDVIIDGINTKVGRRDNLYILGDFALCSAESAGALRKRIKCKDVHLVFGNHDRKSFGQFFSSARDTALVKCGDYKCFLSHYPHVFWPSSHHGSFHLYGHCHYMREAWISNLMPERRSMDVGLDAYFQEHGSFLPYSETEIVEKLLSRPGHVGHHDVEYERSVEENWNSIKKVETCTK